MKHSGGRFFSTAPKRSRKPKPPGTAEAFAKSMRGVDASRMALCGEPGLISKGRLPVLDSATCRERFPDDGLRRSAQSARTDAAAMSSTRPVALTAAVTPCPVRKRSGGYAPRAMSAVALTAGRDRQDCRSISSTGRTFLRRNLLVGAAIRARMRSAATRPTCRGSWSMTVTAGWRTSAIVKSP